MTPERHQELMTDKDVLRVLDSVQSEACMLLYTDTLHGRAVESDNLWVISTAELEQIRSVIEKHERDYPLCAGHADWWFTSRNYLKGDLRCIVCAFPTDPDVDAKSVGGCDINTARACLLEVHKLMADWSIPVRIKPDEQYTVKRVKELLIHYQRKELGYK